MFRLAFLSFVLLGTLLAASVQAKNFTLATLLQRANSSCFKLTTEPAANLDNYCRLNRAYCDNACRYRTKINTCNPNTMVWECVCDGTDPFPAHNFHTFPVQVHQCKGEQRLCLFKCTSKPNVTQSEIETCAAGCWSTFKCGEKDAKYARSYRMGDTMPSACNEPGYIVGAKANSEPAPISCGCNLNSSNLNLLNGTGRNDAPAVPKDGYKLGNIVAFLVTIFAGLSLF
ncbi:hypothetical protein HK102_003369 [Quaeritorhiza haematococci]|nr:hypothetical protein HK102_003369 [Quaeritorhiza haematococci]